MPNPDPSFVKIGDPVTAIGFNSIVGAVRRLDNTTKRQPLKLGGGGGAICPFGEIIYVDGDPFIKGGMIFAGDKNFTVENYEIDVSFSGTKLIFFEIPVEVNRDDSNEIILPGIKTSSWDKEWSDTSDDVYPDNTNPDVGDGIGTIIIPLGSLETNGDSLSSWEPIGGCSNFRVDQCGGTLFYVVAP